MVKQNYLNLLKDTIQNNWDSKALCFFQGEELTFGDLARHIARFHLFFDQAGLKKGDKIAICAKNTNRWATAFLSVTSYGTVIVPILADFHPDSVNKLVDHSDSLILFTDREIWDKLQPELMPQIKAAFNTDDFSLLFSRDAELQSLYENLDKAFEEKYPQGFGKADVAFRVNNEDLDSLAVINYTSGTTSAPKGVMLSYRNISASVEFAHAHIPCHKGDTIVSMLPMAHIYGLVFEFLYPITGGVCVYFLGKSPAPSLLLKAMKSVKPYLVLTVPLVMEKIYKSSVKPAISKPAIKVLSHIPLLNKVVFNKVRSSLDTAFGGNVQMYIMGGAALNPEVEKCFHKIGLHYTVGYGMTEAAPLLAYEAWDKYAVGSCGKKVDCAQVRIDSADSEKIAGEIQAKGENICLGYYKNEEATAATFTEDGFLKTGDLGVIDKQGNIFIKGRSKSMILSANGQNIYPEELEAIINAQPYVTESVVVDRAGKIVGLVYLDQDGIKKAGLDDEAVSEIPENILAAANKKLPAYSKITKIELVLEPFAKTPKMSIKRFLYK
ncbi:MAG: AMP-binding protein [Candidatus Cryptobacteroides sp.]